MSALLLVINKLHNFLSFSEKKRLTKRVCPQQLGEAYRYLFSFYVDHAFGILALPPNPTHHLDQILKTLRHPFDIDISAISVYSHRDSACSNQNALLWIAKRSKVRIFVNQIRIVHSNSPTIQSSPQFVVVYVTIVSCCRVYYRFFMC